MNVQKSLTLFLVPNLTLETSDRHLDGPRGKVHEGQGADTSLGTANYSTVQKSLMITNFSPLMLNSFSLGHLLSEKNRVKTKR